MFTFGFSYVGLIYLLMLFIPNMIWAKNPPEGYTTEDENKVLAIIERIGEVLCTCCSLIFTEFNIRETAWTVWLGLSFVFMILYEIYWVQYFKSGKKLEDFYKPMFVMKVPGATLPVIAFFLLGIYGTNIFMIISSFTHEPFHSSEYPPAVPASGSCSLKSEKTTPVLKLFQNLYMLHISH